MSGALLHTKLYRPHAPTRLVARPRLFDRLNQSVQTGNALMLISAPAGYGKTTLAAAWLQLHAEADESALRCAWLSLDEEDNVPRRFFAYLLAALKGAGLALDAAESALQADLIAETSFMTALLNDLGRQETDQPLIVALDDYHRIQSPDIHAAMQFWLDHAPPHVHLLLLTREDPPLTLARWRVSNRMTELRVGDLRFTPPEAAAFLNESMGLTLTAADIERLDARTEGWVAGLQLAALALRTPLAGEQAGDASTFIAEFGGSHFYVIDYLLEEVLRRQGADVRIFLQQTSILDRLTAPLCDAITGRQDSQELLTDLERRNLFIVPLDNQRRWYRHHHLIADSLQALLADDERAQLHARAARWHEQHGQPSAAVRHALATHDLALAADVMEAVFQRAAAWSQGDVAQLNGWLDALPAALLHARPTLSLHASRALYLAGDLDGAERLVVQAQVALDPDASGTDAESDAAMLATVYQGAINALRGTNLRAVIAAVTPLPERLARTNLHAAARAVDTLGLAHALRGDLIEAEQAYRRTSVLAQQAGVRYLAVNALCEVALIQIAKGELTAAEESCHAALAEADGEAIAPTGLAWAVLGEIERERNDLDAAARHVEDGIRLAQQGGITDDLRYAYLFLARLRQAQGQPEAALDAWRQANRLLQRYNVPRLTTLAAAERARLDLAQGNPAAAQRWVATFQARPNDRALEAVQEFEALTLAHICLATGALDDAATAVHGVLATAQPAGRSRTTMEALLLHGLILQVRGQTAEAVTALRAAVTLAAPAGFVRLFLDMGAPAAALLPGARPAAPAFVDRLLAEFEDVEPSLRIDQSPTELTGVSALESRPDPPRAVAPLLEPLSEREEEVLKLLVAGHTNQEIADTLIITVGTAKWHVHNIYQKLDVNSRAAAIARVHALGLSI